MSSLQTDNSFLSDKVSLRLSHLPSSENLMVLDCFSGHGYIWKEVSRRAEGKKISVVSIDKESKQSGLFLKGDNLKYLLSMDLSRFDVIDLDAYGVPCAQLGVLFEKGYSGTVFVAMIQTGMGCLPHFMLEGLGFTKAQIRKCPTLFNRNGFFFFKSWLSNHGVTSIVHRSSGRKHYLYFAL